MLPRDHFMPLPIVILPGYLAAAQDYLALEQYLNATGFPTVTVPLTRKSWWVTLGGRPVRDFQTKKHSKLKV